MENNKIRSSTADEFLQDFANKINTKEEVLKPEKVNIEEKESKKSTHKEIVTQRVMIKLEANQVAKMNLLSISLRKLLPELIEKYLNEEEQQLKIKKLINTLRK